jgi:organic hydroperoxide reductase OsmC/OhrA
MATPFPHCYDVELAWTGRGGAALSAGPRPVIEGGPPPEFQGKDAWWSPEHLLLSSLSLCLMTTYQAITEKAHLPIAHYDSRAEGVLDRMPTGLGFTRLVLHVAVKVTSREHVDRARQLLFKAKDHCIVARTLMPPVQLEATVTAADTAVM